MRGHDAGEDAVACECVFPVGEAEAEEEAPGGVEGGLLHEGAAEVGGGGVEEGAAGEVARDVGAVVVDEAFELLDGGGEGAAGGAVGGGERAQVDVFGWGEEGSEEVEDGGVEERALRG